jgi:anion-transporting  ArsA/GET3 family ATPase
MDILDRRLLVVTGKGGVGKTTVASALAWQAASIGKRVLLCELDAKGDLLASLQGVSGRASAPLSFTPRELHPGLYAMVMDPEESLKEYLRIYLRLPLITRIGLLSNAFDFLANAAPGVREIVTIGKLAHEVRERHYDLVVVDATASGHIVGLLRAPQAINELVQAGLLRSQTAWILDILGDPKLTAVVAVATPEELPVSETAELFGNLASQTNVSVQTVVVNHVWPVPFTQIESLEFAALRSSFEEGSPVGGSNRQNATSMTAKTVTKSGPQTAKNAASNDSTDVTMNRSTVADKTPSNAALVRGVARSRLRGTAGGTGTGIGIGKGIGKGVGVRSLGNLGEREAKLLIRGVGLAEDLRTESLQHLASLRSIAGSVPMAFVAQLFGVGAGLPVTMAVAEMLAEELS